MIALGGAHARTHAPADIFRALILERITAYGRRDADAYERLLAPDFTHVSDLGERRTRPQVRAFVTGHADMRAVYAISDLTVSVAGSLAIVSAQVSERSPDHVGALRETDIFVRRRGRWLYRSHHETAVYQPPAPVAVTDDRLADYTGRYRSPSGTVDAIEERGGKLVAGAATDSERVTLIPVGRGVFAIPGDPTLLVFVRDRTGSVVGCVWHLPSGQVTNARRF